MTAHRIPLDFAHVFERLPGWPDKVRGPSASGNWVAPCPSHDDRQPSLSLKLGRNGDLVVRCHAGEGCTFATIAASLGLERKDFFATGAAAAPGGRP